MRWVIQEEATQIDAKRAEVWRRENEEQCRERRSGVWRVQKTTFGG